MSINSGQGLRPRIATILASAGAFQASGTLSATSPLYNFTVSADTGLFQAEASVSSTGSGVSPTQVGSITVEGVGTQITRFARPFKRGAVPANAAVTVADSSGNPIQTSCVRQAFHSDGSLRHAVFAAPLTGGVSYRLQTANISSAPNLTVADLLVAMSGDIARMDFSAGVTGAAVLRDLLSSANNRAVNGLITFEQSPGMLTVVASQNITAHLRASFIATWFGGANLRVKYLLQNGYGNLSGANELNYTVAFTLDGIAPRSPITVNHKNATMWTPNNSGYWTAGGTLHVRHPANELNDTRAWPCYGLTQLPQSSYLDSQRSDTAPMSNGDYRANLDGTGADQTLAINPRFDANAVKSGNDLRALNTCLANARGGMAYSYHRLSATTGLHMSEAEFPSASYNQGVGYATGFNAGLAAYTPQGSSISSHTPSVGYTAYLLTGDWDFMHVMLGWTCFTNLWQSVERNFTFNGRNLRMPSNQSLRGMGWQMRSNAQAAFAIPDSHPQKQYLVDWVNGNAGLLTSLYGIGGSLVNSIGAFYMAEGNNNYKLFFHDLASQSYCHTYFDLGFTSMEQVAKYSLILIAGLCGNTLEFPFEACPSEVKKLGDTAQGAFYASFTQVRANNLASTEDTGSKALALYLQGIDGSHSGNINEMLRQNDATGYFANTRPCLAYMQEADVPDGFGLWYRSTLSPVQPDFRNFGEFDIVPRKVLPPSWVRTLEVNQLYKIPNTALSLVAPSPTPPGNSGVASVVNTWNGAMSRRRQSVYLQLACGGHADYAGNELYARFLNSETPGVVLKRAPSAAATVSNNVRRYSDGRASSRHTYYNQQFVNALDKALQMGSASIYDATVGGRSYAHCDFYDWAANDWDAVNTSLDALECAGEKPIATSPSTGFIYYFRVNASPGTLYRYNPKTGTSKKIADTFEYQEIDQCAAVDPIRHRILIGPNAVPGSGWKYYDLGTGARTNVTIDVGGDAPQGSLQWDVQGNDGYLYCRPRAGANAIYKIHPTTFVATLLALTGDALPLITNPDNVGLFNRMQQFPELGGIAIQTNYTENLNFIKLYPGAA